MLLVFSKATKTPQYSLDYRYTDKVIHLPHKSLRIVKNLASGAILVERKIMDQSVKVNGNPTLTNLRAGMD